MFGKRRVRRAGSLRTRATRRSLERRIRQLGGGHTAVSAPTRHEKYTAIDDQEVLASKGIEIEREADAQRDLAKPEKKIAHLMGRLETARKRMDKATEEYATAAEARSSFASRFSHAVELLAKRREAAWKYIVVILLGLGASVALDYMAMSYLAPNLGSGANLPWIVNWFLENLAIIGTICLAGTEAMVVKYCGREAASGFSPLVHNLAATEPDDVDGSSDGRSSQPVVYTERSRRGHQVACAFLILVLVGVIIALVALRELALNLLSGLSGGSDISGLAASQAHSTPGSGGFTLAVGLFMVSAFPLLAAGWAVYLRESPLSASMATLTSVEKRKFKALVKAMKARAAIEAQLVNLGITMDLIAAERDADQHLARLAPHMAHAVMVEAQPELFGMVSDKVHPLLRGTDDLASPYPKHRQDVAEWLAQHQPKAQPEPEAASANGNHGSGSS